MKLRVSLLKWPKNYFSLSQIAYKGRISGILGTCLLGTSPLIRLTAHRGCITDYVHCPSTPGHRCR